MAHLTLARVGAVAGFAFVLLAAGLLPGAGETVPVLLPANGAAPNASSRSPMLAARGRAATFATQATNLVPGDADSLLDVLVVRLKTGQPVCASVSTEGVKADADSDNPVLDARGRCVAFVSEATNLVAGDTNGLQDVFVRDLKLGTTTRVSVAGDGTQADGASYTPSISSDGRRVIFSSVATNLVPDDTNGVSDIFERDLQTGTTTRVSVAADGSQLDGTSLFPRISGNGRFVAYASGATNAVPGDANGMFDVFVRDLVTGAVDLVSVATDGTQANRHALHPSISANGRRVAFESMASSLSADDHFAGSDVFVRDRKKHVTTLVSIVPGGAPDGESTQAALSANGRWLAFTSDATNLVPSDTNGVTDVFRRKLKTGATERLSISSQGVEGDGNSVAPALSANGRLAVFATRSGNLFPQTNAGLWTVALRKP